MHRTALPSHAPTSALAEGARKGLGPSHLDLPLFYADAAFRDPFTVRDAVRGLQVFGATGSGKTGGIGQLLARTFLANGFGGLVLTTKSEERGLWTRYAELEGRADDLIVFDTSGTQRFNPLTHLLSSGPENLFLNAVQLIYAALEVSGRGSGGDKGANQFWEDAARQLLTRAVVQCWFGTGTLSLQTVVGIVDTAPRSESDLTDPEWYDTTLCGQTLAAARPDAAKESDDPERAEFMAQTLQYWRHRWCRMTDQVRGGVAGTLTATLDPLLVPPFTTLLGSDSTFVPEDAFGQDGGARGKVILLDLPRHAFGTVGKMVQMMVKASFQRSVLIRDRSEAIETALPVFIFADEAQLLLSKGDREYIETARSNKGITVYMTQNIENYTAEMKAMGLDADYARAFVGTMGTKVFHANSDPKTNELAADILGQEWVHLENYNRGVSYGQSETFGKEYSFGRNQGASQGVSLQNTRRYRIEPGDFGLLAQPTQDNGFVAEAVCYSVGKIWRSTGTNHVRMRIPMVQDLVRAEPLGPAPTAQRTRDVWDWIGFFRPKVWAWAQAAWGRLFRWTLGGATDLQKRLEAERKSRDDG